MDKNRMDKLNRVVQNMTELNQRFTIRPNPDYTPIDMEYGDHVYVMVRPKSPEGWNDPKISNSTLYGSKRFEVRPAMISGHGDAQKIFLIGKTAGYDPVDFDILSYVLPGQKMIDSVLCDEERGFDNISRSVEFYRGNYVVRVDSFMNFEDAFKPSFCASVSVDITDGNEEGGWRKVECNFENEVAATYYFERFYEIAVSMLDDLSKPCDNFEQVGGNFINKTDGSKISIAISPIVQDEPNL